MASSRILHSFAVLLTVIVMTRAVVALHVGTTNKTESLLHSDGISWELLDVMAKQVTDRYAKESYDLTQGDSYLSSLWARYLSSPRSEKPETVEEIREAVKHMVNLDATLEMIEVLLFGPPFGPVRDPGLDLVVNWECLKPTVDLFEKHCGVMTRYSLRHLTTFGTICGNLDDRDAVEEVFKVACRYKILE